MQGIGTGGSEYIVMIVAYALLAILFVALTLYKWRKERTGIVFTVFETYVVILELFFALRIGVLSFLLYLRFSYLPKFIGSSTSTDALALTNLDSTAQSLLVTWELLSILGTDCLYAAFSCLIYKWRLLLTMDKKGSFILVLGLNGILSIISVVAVCMQFAFDKSTMAFVHVTYYFVAANYCVMAVCLGYYSYVMNNIVDIRQARSALAKRVFAATTDIRYSAMLLAVIIFVRAVAIAIDNVGYRYLLNGTAGQVIWNIVFKYIMWIVPEFVAIVLSASIFLDTEDFHAMMAVQEAKMNGTLPATSYVNEYAGEAYGQVPNVDIESLDDVLQAEKQKGRDVPESTVTVSEVELEEMSREIQGESDNRRGRDGEYVMLDD